jgi:hypothetical protein
MSNGQSWSSQKKESQVIVQESSGLFQWDDGMAGNDERATFSTGSGKPLRIAHYSSKHGR